MFENDWENFRAEAHAYMKDKEETIIKKWLTDIKYTEPVGYYRNISEKVMEIYATRPGLLIGKAGVDVEKFRKMLNVEFGGEWKVKFVEIRGGFLQI